MLKASDFITRVLGVKAKAGYIIKDSLSSSVLYFFNLSDSTTIPLSNVYIPDTQVLEPLYHGSSGGSATSMDFYKCSAVNSDSTWSGYKAVLNQLGYYLFLSESTEGLTYNSAKLTPIVNLCYTDGALLAVNPYSPDIIQVDANTMFLLQGSLHDKSGHVADAHIINNGIVVTDGKLVCTNNGYAQILANSLPDSVYCDDKDWTFEASVTVTSVSRSQTIFGRGSGPRGDVTAYVNFWYVNIDGGEIRNNTIREGTHTIKLTHSSSNKFALYVDGNPQTYVDGSDTKANRNYRTLPLYIGYDGEGSYFNNIINWLRISDCIR